MQTVSHSQAHRASLCFFPLSIGASCPASATLPESSKFTEIPTAIYVDYLSASSYSNLECRIDLTGNYQFVDCHYLAFKRMKLIHLNRGEKTMTKEQRERVAGWQAQIWGVCER